MRRRRSAARRRGSAAAVALALTVSVPGCASGVDPDAVLGDTADLTPANAGELSSDLDFAARDVPALERVCDRLDRVAAGEALGGDVAPYTWADSECVFAIAEVAAAGGVDGEGAAGLLVVAMLSSEEGPELWRTTRKMLRVTFAVDDVEGVGDEALYDPPSGALYVLDGPQLLLFQHVAGTSAAPADLPDALAEIAGGVLGNWIDG